MSERENNITELQLPAPDENPLIICKAADEDAILKTHIIKTKVKSELDVSIKLLNNTPEKEEFTRGDIVEAHESVASIKEDHVQNPHCGIPASNDIFGAEEATHFKIEDNESLDLKIFVTHSENEDEIKNHSLNVEEFLKNEVDGEVDFRLTEEIGISRYSTLLRSRSKPGKFPNYKKNVFDSFALAKHKTKNTKEIAFICNICNKSFSMSANLEKHMRIHKGETPFTCNICNKSFSQSSNLKTHLRIHTGETPFTCNICNKRFAQSSNLVKHIRIHTGETPFTCSICNKSFSMTSKLVKHMRIHTGETPFTCNICNKSFSLFSNLKTHKRIHKGETPFTCNVCNKSFSRVSHLVTHMRIHTGETPFTCNTCNKRFSQSTNLRTHMRIHTGETPFACNICNKRFSQSCNLKTHMRIHSETHLALAIVQ